MSDMEKRAGLSELEDEMLDKVAGGTDEDELYLDVQWQAEIQGYRYKIPAIENIVDKYGQSDCGCDNKYKWAKSKEQIEPGVFRYTHPKCFKCEKRWDFVFYNA